MSKRPLMEAAFRINAQTEFREFREWLAAEQKKALAVLTSSRDDKQMYVAQGDYNRLQAIKDLLGGASAYLSDKRG